ncbi:MAG: hypothetical protein HC771_25245 [Synechococcales cyanobacterium CRU_2_2]|nr:hypothetical protein [Synechococcales cyanobacterium CRU_2_2]
MDPGLESDPSAAVDQAQAIQSSLEPDPAVLKLAGGLKLLLPKDSLMMRSLTLS